MRPVDLNIDAQPIRDNHSPPSQKPRPLVDAFISFLQFLIIYPDTMWKMCGVNVSSGLFMQYLDTHTVLNKDASYSLHPDLTNKLMNARVPINPSVEDCIDLNNHVNDNLMMAYKISFLYWYFTGIKAVLLPILRESLIIILNKKFAATNSNTRRCSTQSEHVRHNTGSEVNASITPNITDDINKAQIKNVVTNNKPYTSYSHTIALLVTFGLLVIHVIEAKPAYIQQLTNMTELMPDECSSDENNIFAIFDIAAYRISNCPDQYTAASVSTYAPFLKEVATKLLENYVLTVAIAAGVDVVLYCRGKRSVIKQCNPKKTAFSTYKLLKNHLTNTVEFLKEIRTRLLENRVVTATIKALLDLMNYCKRKQYIIKNAAYHAYEILKKIRDNIVIISYALLPPTVCISLIYLVATYLNALLIKDRCNDLCTWLQATECFGMQGRFSYLSKAEGEKSLFNSLYMKQPAETVKQIGDNVFGGVGLIFNDTLINTTDSTAIMLYTEITRYEITKLYKIAIFWALASITIGSSLTICRRQAKQWQRLARAHEASKLSLSNLLFITKLLLVVFVLVVGIPSAYNYERIKEPPYAFWTFLQRVMATMWDDLSNNQNVNPQELQNHLQLVSIVFLPALVWSLFSSHVIYEVLWLYNLGKNSIKDTKGAQQAQGEELARLVAAEEEGELNNGHVATPEAANGSKCSFFRSRMPWCCPERPQETTSISPLIAPSS